ncbi:uncharacterized protein J8A68_003972 [[Candida] subhashii]|uniref:Uncharacterized protein n=1 Tax=[Candida] subhashii TaxID=561895 RepID=A0A8J5UGJ3_9ASCO|nr:uncharacterized protein J8A68_003972 [[Candida] subhashii]KAG7662508.1 hypothetical protein J8A68_003972 [[Candida] subhashii]
MSSVDSSKSIPKKGSSIMKSVTSGSSWISPFRSTGENEKQKKVNLHQKLRDENKIDQIKVPAKFATHPTLEAEEARKKREAQEAEEAKKRQAEEEEAKKKREEEGEGEGEGEGQAKDEEAEATEREGSTKDITEEAGEAEPTSVGEATAETEVAEEQDNLPSKTEQPAEPAIAETNFSDRLESRETMLPPDQQPANTNVSDVTEAEAEQEPALAAQPVTASSSVYADEQPAADDVPKEKVPEEETPKEEAPPVDQSTELKNATDDNVEQLVKETPIELAAQPGTKYEPVELANQETLDKLKDKPALLKRYEELNVAAIGSVARKVDDPNKVIDLGSGLKMTQQQLLDIAAKRVAPVLANINQEVSKTREEDEIKRQQEISNKVQKHEFKLTGEFEKHLKKIGKKKEKFDREIEEKINNIILSMKNSTLAAEEFETQTKEEIETANNEYEERETKAKEQHETDKETLIKNHEELVATKEQELQDCKTNQETTTQEIEQLQEKKSELDNKNSESSNQIEELTARLNEETAKLDELKAKYNVHDEAINSNLSKKKELEDEVVQVKQNLSEKKERHVALSAAVGALAGTVAAYTAKLTTLNTDKEARGKKLKDAQEKYHSWQAERRDMAEEVAREHERRRLETAQEYETRKHEEELQRQHEKEERERQEKEQAEELAREAEKHREEIARLEKEQAEWEAKEKLLEQQQAREEEEMKSKDPEFQLGQAIQRREVEQKKLEEERAEQDRIYQERVAKDKLEQRQLEEEIAALQAERAKAAEMERDEAEQIANIKLSQIEKLKQEHEAKLTLYRQRLEFENLQKQRLSEEVENLKKIRALREEKARLASQTYRDPKVEEIKKLIQERELEVERLTKKIELDQPGLGGSSSFLGTSNEISSSSGNRAIPQSKEIEQPASDKKEKSSGHKRAIAAGLVGGTLAAAAGGIGAALGSAGKYGSKVVSSGADKIPSSNAGTVSKVSKDVVPKEGGEYKSSSGNSGTTVKVSKNILPKGEVGGGDKSSIPRVLSDDESYEVVSVYELVSDGEFQSHEQDPNYFEVTSAEFEKHKALEKEKTLLGKIPV